MTEQSGKRPAIRSAIRDGGAILAAILIAFALDAWWGENDQTKKTEDLLVVMRGEFDATVLQLDSIIDHNNKDLELKSAFLVRSGADERPIPADSLAHYVGSRDEAFQLYDPAFGALNTLISSGGLERVADPTLQQALGGWAGELEDIVYEHEQVRWAHQQWMLAAMSAGAMSRMGVEAVGFDSEESIATLTALANSQGFRQATGLMLFTQDDYQRDLIKIRSRAARIAEMLPK